MKRYKLLQEKRENIIKNAQKYGAFNILKFGLVAREEDSNDSDIDFLIIVVLLLKLLGLSDIVSSVCVMQWRGVIRDRTLIEKDIWRFLFCQLFLSRAN